MLLERLGAGRGLRDLITVAPQRVFERAADGRVVVDYQDAHGWECDADC
ncbi:hypothetical protein ACFQ9X_14175 [Catenulispora yoronensis]